VRVRARALERDSIPRVALIDLLPAGLEAIGERGEPIEGSWQPEYSETREDRVIAYGSVGRDAAEFRYKTRAVARGRFTAPPAYAESMYDRTAVARTASGTFEVR
jgi:alpha-2-macroglobulin